MVQRRTLLRAGFGAPLILPGRMLHAQGTSWPGERQAKIIVPLAPGGTADLLARLIAQRLTERAEGRATVVVENRTGAGNAIGWAAAARAAPDGNTALFTDNSLAMAIPLRQEMGFDPRTDLVPVTRVADLAPVFCVPNESPYRTIGDLVAAAKARPEAINYGSGGNGSAPHLATEYFSHVAGIRMTHVGYRGMAQATQDLAGGRVSFIISTQPTVAGLLGAGSRIRIIAVGTGSRHPALPDVPTVKEAGLHYELSFWFGLFAPKGTPPALVTAMQEAVAASVSDPASRRKMEEMGATFVLSTPDAFRADIATEAGLWSSIVRERQIRIE
ncbi:tripartite tricarboxylate transporter substrate binding protein [Roseomonas sp. KE2513]|uniref:Bug family tripartite tricarboxylate transporter substrate binding protein n=1 Tax=Roseomonas sp. KE2513 TaxID=2479202 RepID=UPI0018DFF912|nr:tripartite tricarboxylate transporter substrate-binding protein [Roseomonas sp. KE2513]MBI0539189.1 tripartite tricarboxylate transporter substrate binding protein [Roseomonas sp. KE2513]